MFTRCSLLFCSMYEGSKSNRTSILLFQNRLSSILSFIQRGCDTYHIIHRTCTRASYTVPGVKATCLDEVLLLLREPFIYCCAIAPIIDPRPAFLFFHTRTISPSFHPRSLGPVSITMVSITMREAVDLTLS